MRHLLPALAALTLFAGCAAQPEDATDLSYNTAELRGGNGNGNMDCSLVRCFAVECPDGFRRHYTPSNCCGTCIPEGGPATDGEGQCTTAADCEGLIHIACVGSWSCDAGYCAYACDTTVLELQ